MTQAEAVDKQLYARMSWCLEAAEELIDATSTKTGETYRSGDVTMIAVALFNAGYRG